MRAAAEQVGARAGEYLRTGGCKVSLLCSALYENCPYYVLGTRLTCSAEILRVLQIGDQSDIKATRTSSVFGPECELRERKVCA